MDRIMNAGKDFLETQSQGRSHDAGENSPSSGGRQHPDRRHDDLRAAHEEAAQRAGSSGSSALFSQIVGALGQRKGQLADEDLDEADAVHKHKETYLNDGRGDENSLGVAAAMQALKLFGQGQASGVGSAPGGKPTQGAFLGLAMSEASKLFDKAAQGKLPAGASKESTVQKAGEMAMKMYFKSQDQQQGGLLGLASKFM